GLWSNPDTWNDFTPVANDTSRFSVISRADYHNNPQYVLSTNPVYNPPLHVVNPNALGFAFNIGSVQYYITEALRKFRSQNAAAAQVDVVAHSMGGVITRTLENSTYFTGISNFGNGEIHKVITIGTPHLGSPAATDMLVSSPPAASNECLRSIFAKNGNLALYSVVLDQPGN